MWKKLKFEHNLQFRNIDNFCCRKYLIPDSNDEIRQEQMREMELITVGTGDNSSLVVGLAGITAQSGINFFAGLIYQKFSDEVWEGVEFSLN